MKNRKRFSLIICAILTVSVIFGTVGLAFADGEGSEAPKAKNGLSKLEDLNGKNLGVQTGVLYEDLIKDDLEGEEWY
ncbi:MAG: hypothetical protein J5622_03935, partial [Firmicutes bacterium]|nr:hypothetical protein [Bacillota bacterium]